MIDASELETEFPLATAGDIAVNNLKSARDRSWSRYWQEPQRTGIAEYIVEQEQLAAQFLGDLDALDRLGTLVDQLDRIDAASMRTALVTAQVASMRHRFAEARSQLANAAVRGAPPAAVDRLSLSIDQACGTNLDAVLAARRRMAAESGQLEDLVPLGALLADLREFNEADRTYRRALEEYQDVSPFAVAWVCFQLGVLWGELVPERQSSRAAHWYLKAIQFLPPYVKARVHLAEIYSDDGRRVDAEAVLIPAISTGDPEACWRLADLMNVKGCLAEAEALMESARSGFEALLTRHLLAFADHGAEFYLGSGNDAGKALELVSINVENRPTLRAFEQAHAAAVRVRNAPAASYFLAAAGKRWGETAAFRLSPLATCRCESANDDARCSRTA